MKADSEGERISDVRKREGGLVEIKKSILKTAL